MRLQSLKVVALSIEELFKLIMTDKELEKDLRDRSTKNDRHKISMAKMRKDTLSLDAKRRFLQSMGFYEVQPSTWKLKQGKNFEK